MQLKGLGVEDNQTIDIGKHQEGSNEMAFNVASGYTLCHEVPFALMK